MVQSKSIMTPAEHNELKALSAALFGGDMFVQMDDNDPRVARYNELMVKSQAARRQAAINGLSHVAKRYITEVWTEKNRHYTVNTVPTITGSWSALAYQELRKAGFIRQLEYSQGFAKFVIQ